MFELPFLNNKWPHSLKPVYVAMRIKIQFFLLYFTGKWSYIAFQFVEQYGALVTNDNRHAYTNLLVQSR